MKSFLVCVRSSVISFKERLNGTARCELWEEVLEAAVTVVVVVLSRVWEALQVMLVSHLHVPTEMATVN